MSDESAETDEETYSAIRTVLGSTRRTARWHLTDEVDVLTALGRSSFDLRLVETTGRPVAEISVTCLLGSVSLVVPPGTLVVLDGNSFLARAASEVEPGDVSSLPRIEVTATTILGRVKIVSRDAEATPVAVVDPTTAATDWPEDTASETAPAPAEELDEAAVETTIDAPPDADDDAAPLAS